jgi:hypothetical protein
MTEKPTVHGAADALELPGPHGWLFRLDPDAVVNIRSCGWHWSWVTMAHARRGPLLIRGNATEIQHQCEVLRAKRRASRAQCAAEPEEPPP